MSTYDGGAEKFQNGHDGMEPYEVIARHFLEGHGGLFDIYLKEGVLTSEKPPHPEAMVETAVWVLQCLTNPIYRRELEALLNQSDLRTVDSRTPGNGSERG